MERRHRLRQKSDFRQTRLEGRSWAHPLVVVYVRRNGLSVSRFGFSVGKRVGKAVVRNRARRRLREVVRLLVPSIEAGWDALFIARPPIASASYGDIAVAVETLLRRAGLLTIGGKRT
jgi:ribonuclease P protein component